ncbi:MAG: DegQ family serine endoprotease [Thermodesulfovibrionales bacterium]
MVGRKVLIGVAVLLLGFALGAFSMRFFEEEPLMSPAPRAPAPRAEAALASAGRDFAAVADAVSPSVVNISTIRTLGRGDREDAFSEFFGDFFSPFYDLQKKWTEQGTGSGVIVSPNGYIITNNHVVAGADRIKVTLYDKRVFTGKVVGADPKTDIAVVKISASELPTAPWGDSDRLRVGEFVLAIGNPFGLSHTVTLGIISAVGRANVGIADYEDLIQTDAAINPGNSGGPLVNGDGDLIGINTAIFSKSGGYQGIGFAVPSNMARLIMEQLVQKGKVTRGWLGVTIQELTPELARKFGHGSSGGVLLDEALKGSPADRAGLRRGDIVLDFDGKPVESPSALRNMVASYFPGKKVPLRILRDKKVMKLTVTVGELPPDLESPSAEPASESSRDAFYGLSVITLTEDMARQLDLARDETGVVVVRVRRGSAAEEAGLKRGDVIKEIDHKVVMGLEDFEGIASGTAPGDTVLMFINRGGRKFYITVAS